MSYNSFKRRSCFDTAIIHPNRCEIERVPRQFCDFMAEQCTRFDEICCIYLEGMTLDDVQFMRPKDFINLVPDVQYRHKLLMTIMVRRYIFPCDSDTPACCDLERCGSSGGDTYTDNISNDTSCSEKTEYKCNKCNHTCTNRNCTHKCSDYTKNSKRNK